jgi:hypothetical protein
VQKLACDASKRLWGRSGEFRELACATAPSHTLQHAATDKCALVCLLRVVLVLTAHGR